MDLARNDSVVVEIEVVAVAAVAGIVAAERIEVVAASVDMKSVALEIAVAADIANVEGIVVAAAMGTVPVVALVNTAALEGYIALAVVASGTDCAGGDAATAIAIAAVAEAAAELADWLSS